LTVKTFANRLDLSVLGYQGKHTGLPLRFVGMTFSYCVLRSVAGGRNEETYSKYAIGIRKNKIPNWRQHEQESEGGGQIHWLLMEDCRASSFAKATEDRTLAMIL